MPLVLMPWITEDKDEMRGLHYIVEYVVIQWTFMRECRGNKSIGHLIANILLVILILGANLGRVE